LRQESLILNSGACLSGVCLNKNYWVANWTNYQGDTKSAYFNINKFGYEVVKQLAINKRLEMELSLNHYWLALHGLLPLELQDDSDTNYDFEEVEDAN